MIQLNETDLQILKALGAEVVNPEMMDEIDTICNSRKIMEFLIWTDGVKCFLNTLGTPGKINGEALGELEKWIEQGRLFYDAEYRNIF